MKFSPSRFGQQLAMGSGIGELMDDLGEAMASGGEDILFLGGGQPARIPEVEAMIRRQTEALFADGDTLERVIGVYDGPAGNDGFRAALAGLLREEYGWDVGVENVAVTSGGQVAFLYLFNLLCGAMPDGSFRRVLLPLVPEYIGYADQGVAPGTFVACRPLIEEGEDGRSFKYRIDFEAIEQVEDIGAVCVSRPTNPSGNVLTDNEMAKLRDFAQSRGVPLIVDNAYGAPFPDILFDEDTAPTWDEGMVLTMSLSKLGLPGTRTAAVVAEPGIVKAISSMNAIACLANNNLGQAIVTPLLENREVLRVSCDVIRPYYHERAKAAQAIAHEVMPADVPWKMHQAEGALFLWFWFPGLPITSKELYSRLKARGVLVVPGEYFFFGNGWGTPEDWPHAHECLRVSYALGEETVRAGLQIIGEEVAQVMASGTSQ